MNNNGLDNNENNNAEVNKDEIINTVLENTDVNNQMNSNERVVFNNIDNVVMESDPSIQENDNNMAELNRKFTPINNKIEENNEVIEPEKKKSKLFKVLISVIIVVVLGASVLLAYNLVFAKPYIKGIDKLFNTIKNSYVLKDSYKITTSTSLKAKNEEASFLNGIKLDTTTSVDQKNNKNLITIDYSEDNNKLLSVKTLLEDNKIYIHLNEMFDKPLFYDISSILENNKKINKEDLEYLTNTFYKMLKASLKDEKPIKTKTNVTLNGENLNLTANKYVVDSKNIDRIFSNSVDVLLKDDKAIEIISEYTNTDKSEIINQLEKDKNIDSNIGNNDYIMGDSSQKDYTLFELTIYTKGFLNDVVGFGLNENYTNLEYYENKDYTKFQYSSGYSSKMNFVIEGSKEKTITLSSGSENYLNGKLIKNSDTDYSISLDIYNYLTVDSSYKVDELKNIDSFDTSNAVSIDKLNETDMQTILANLQESLTKSKIYKYYEKSTRESLEESYKKHFIIYAKEVITESLKQRENDNKKAVKYYKVNGKDNKKCGKSLDLISDIDYYIEIDKEGNVVKYYASDGMYYIAYEKAKNGNNIAKGLDYNYIDEPIDASYETDGDRMIHKFDTTTYKSIDIGCGKFKLNK